MKIMETNMEKIIYIPNGEDDQNAEIVEKRTEPVNEEVVWDAHAELREKIADAIDLYVNEPQSDVFEIRSIPNPDVLVDFIYEALRAEL